MKELIKRCVTSTTEPELGMQKEKLYGKKNGKRSR